MFWNVHSKWIWIDESKESDSYGEFFTTFVCKEKSAKIRISADSNYVLFLNENFINSGQYPDFPHYKVYDELDLSPYCIDGENKLAIIVWYYGTPNMSYYPGNAALRFEVYNNSEILAYSDAKTQSRQSKAIKTA